MAFDGGQEVVKIMGYAAGKGTDGFHLLGLCLLVF